MLHELLEVHAQDGSVFYVNLNLVMMIDIASPDLLPIKSILHFGERLSCHTQESPQELKQLFYEARERHIKLVMGDKEKEEDDKHV